MGDPHGHGPDWCRIIPPKEEPTGLTGLRFALAVILLALALIALRLTTNSRRVWDPLETPPGELPR